MKQSIMNPRSGQTLVEFIFLLAVLFSMSTVFMKAVNSGIGTRWEATITKIIGHDLKNPDQAVLP